MKRNTNILLAIGLILIAALARVVNREMHMYNLAPVAALGLFSGAIIKDKRLAFLMPLLSLFIADLYFQFFGSVRGFYGIEQLFVYGGMALVTLLGTKMGQIKAQKVLGFSLAGSLLFFIVSNFGVWVGIELGKTDLYGYGSGFSGLVATYVAALPFYKNEFATQLFLNTFIGDIVGCGLLFGSYFLAQRSLKSSTAKA